MKNTEIKKILDRIERRHIRWLRFCAGLRELAVYHRAKLAIPIGYLLAVALIWGNWDKILSRIPCEGIAGLILRRCASFAALAMSIVILVEIIIALGTPCGAARIQAALVEAGFVNAARTPPLLLSIRKAATQEKLYEFDPGKVPLSRWNRDKEKIGAALRCQVVSIKLSTDGKRVLVHGVPLQSALSEVIDWKDEYLSPEDFKLILGKSLTGKLETVDLTTTPHLLIGGGTGSGKSLLLKCLLMQALKKEAVVILADFKGGVDYAPVWHEKCQMVFDPDTLQTTLEELTAELERRRELFVAAGTAHLAEYNKATGKNLPRYIFACDEVAEVLDTTGLSKAQKEDFAKIIHHLSLLARQGRAFGLHLALATQRPDAALIPGQIRTNLPLRICGRADDILSRIILDGPAAAEQIPPDAKGRFVTNMGQTFQGFLFDDSILNE